MTFSALSYHRVHKPLSFVEKCLCLWNRKIYDRICVTWALDELYGSIHGDGRDEGREVVMVEVMAE